VVSATFSPDGAHIVTASIDGTARIWQLDPIVLVSADRRQHYVCRNRLIGARAFTEREMQEPILRARGELRYPCNRIGPLSLDYYWRQASGLFAMVRRALLN
jgi:hypothetical protein